MPTSLSSLSPFRRAGQGLQGEKTARLQRPGLRLTGSKSTADLPMDHHLQGHRASGDLSGFEALVSLLFTQQNSGTKAKNERGHWTQILGSGSQ